MPAKPLPRPTEAELELLRALWTHGPMTVREIHDSLRNEKSTGYTTTLKILQKMADKGIVRRDESNRSHIYHPMMQAEQTQRQLVRDLLHRAFGGSAAQMVVQAAPGGFFMLLPCGGSAAQVDAQAWAENKASPAELAEIRRLLDEMEARQNS